MTAAGPGEPILALAGVGFAYPGTGGTALDDVSLSVDGGEGVALLGHNGAGKTTLIRLAMALIQPVRGDVRVAGRTTRGLGPEDLAPVAGYLFQQPESQLFERTVRAEIGFGPRQLGWGDDRIDERIGTVLELLELTDAAEEHPYDLPLPRRRLVALAAAIAAAPRLLLLDEPTAGLDRRARMLVARVVRGHVGAGGAAVAVTHDTRFALEVLPRAIVLERGRMVAEAPTSEILALADPALPLPPHAAVSQRLGLASRGLQLAEVAAALARHCSAAG